MPERMPTGAPKPDQSEDDKRQDAFVEFVKSRGFSAEQLQTAYYRMLGDAESGAGDQAIDELCAKMREMADDGFPVNRFASFVREKRGIENAPVSCIGYIDSLAISENEKRMLRSIVERRRNGEVSISIDNREVASFRVRTPESATTEQLALEFQDVLRKIIDRIPTGRRYEFNFIEE